MVAGRPRFAKGGQLVVKATPPVGIASTTGLYLDGNDQGSAGQMTRFIILPGARGLAR